MIQNENEFKLNIITPEGRNFEKEVWFVRLPGVRGDIGVLKSHSPALIELVPGKILIKSSDTEPERFFVPGGTAQVLVDQVTILTEYFEKIADIDISAAEAEALPTRGSPTSLKRVG